MRPGLALLFLLLSALAAPATASEWGAIMPGTSTMDAVRAQYGGPTRVQNEKLEGYDVASWVYEGAQAPVGMKRMIVDFGLVETGSYHRDVVRAFRLEPNAGAFNRANILNGWGLPASVVTEAEGPVFFFAEGLFVYFEKDGWSARLMIFTPPQPLPTGRSRQEPAKTSP